MPTKDEVTNAQKDAEAAYLHMIAMKGFYEASYQVWMKKKNKFANLDRQLAETDGRLKVLPPKEHSQKKPKKPIELSLDDIKALCERLGVKVNEKTPADEEIEALESAEPDQSEEE